MSTIHTDTRLGNIHSGGSGVPVSNGTVADADEYLNAQAYALAADGYAVRDNRPASLSIDASRGATWITVKALIAATRRCTSCNNGYVEQLGVSGPIGKIACDVCKGTGREPMR